MLDDAAMLDSSGYTEGDMNQKKLRTTDVPIATQNGVVFGRAKRFPYSGALHVRTVILFENFFSWQPWRGGGHTHENKKNFKCKKK